MKRELTCIVCPVGCTLVVDLDGKEIKDVKGNTCPRGKEYAINECTNPLRTITTTVRCENGTVIPVKTSCPIPKDRLFDAMNIINAAVARLPICTGDVIIKDVFGSDVVSTLDVQQ